MIITINITITVTVTVTLTVLKRAAQQDFLRIIGNEEVLFGTYGLMLGVFGFELMIGV